MHKVLEILAKYIGLPLVQKLVGQLVEFLKREYGLYKAKKEISKKVKAYEEDSSDDNFNNLP